MPIISTFTAEDGGSDSDSGDSLVFEHAFQQSDFKSSACTCPDKVGEIIAAIYVSMICKSLRTLIAGRHLCRPWIIYAPSRCTYSPLDCTTERL